MGFGTVEDGSRSIGARPTRGLRVPDFIANVLLVPEERPTPRVEPMGIERLSVSCIVPSTTGAEENLAVEPERGFGARVPPTLPSQP